MCREFAGIENVGNHDILNFPLELIAIVNRTCMQMTNRKHTVRIRLRRSRYYPGKFFVIYQQVARRLVMNIKLDAWN